MPDSRHTSMRTCHFHADIGACVRECMHMCTLRYMPHAELAMCMHVRACSVCAHVCVHACVGGFEYMLHAELDACMCVYACVYVCVVVWWLQVACRIPWMAHFAIATMDGPFCHRYHGWPIFSFRSVAVECVLEGAMDKKVETAVVPNKYAWAGPNKVCSVE